MVKRLTPPLEVIKDNLPLPSLNLLFTDYIVIIIKVFSFFFLIKKITPNK